MKKQPLLVSLLLSVILLANSSCIFPISNTTINGYVRTYGKPVSNADISFGGSGMEAKTTTDAKGFFTVTVWHRPAQMLYLKVKAKGYAMRDKVEFPGFAAPNEDIIVEMLETVRY